LRLLFDEDLSHRLVDRLSDAFPSSQHVRDIGMKASPDRAVLTYVALNDLVVVTKDADFDDMALLGVSGARVVRLDIGNCTTDDVDRVLRLAATALPGLLNSTRLVSLVGG
jgi:predicted nuclease of predicted toxin-antitoxin system